jgi:(2Fe-2S) ferredoxin
MCNDEWYTTSSCLANVRREDQEEVYGNVKQREAQAVANHDHHTKSGEAVSEKAIFRLRAHPLFSTPSPHLYVHVFIYLLRIF